MDQFLSQQVTPHRPVHHGDGKGRAFALSGHTPDPQNQGKSYVERNHIYILVPVTPSDLCYCIMGNSQLRKLLLLAEKISQC